MSIKSKIATVAIALAVTSFAVGSASAKPKFNPVVPALVGAAVIGTAVDCCLAAALHVTARIATAP